MNNPVLLNAHAHDAKHVLSFATLRNCRNPSDPLRSLIFLLVPQCHILYNVIYCITCTLCTKLYIGKTGRRLDDRFREHLREVEKEGKKASKQAARHFNLSNYSKKHMAFSGLSLSREYGKPQNSRKMLFFKSTLLILTVLTNAFHSTNLFYCFPRY